MSTLKHDAELLAEYIANQDCEQEDFAENPDSNHIYFYAIRVLCGEREARQRLREAKAELLEKERA